MCQKERQILTQERAESLAPILHGVLCSNCGEKEPLLHQRKRTAGVSVRNFQHSTSPRCLEIRYPASSLQRHDPTAKKTAV